MQPTDIAKTIKRLQLIKSLIALEEEDDIARHCAKIEQQILTSELQAIVDALKEKFYSKSIIAIEIFITKYQQITVYADPEIDALKLEIKALEGEINTLSDEKADLEKLIHEFGIRHNQELGELIIKILQYRKEQANGTPEQQEAEEDYDAYHKEYEAAKDEHVAVLTTDEQKELKDKYRKASKLCHPDVVSDEQKDLATKLFAELSTAYEKNDLEKVKEILANLEKGHFFCSKSDTINEKVLLQTEMEKLRLRIKALKEQLQNIKESDTYKTVSNITNWDDYFTSTKQQLSLQLNNLEHGKQ